MVGVQALEKQVVDEMLGGTSSRSHKTRTAATRHRSIRGLAIAAALCSCASLGVSAEIQTRSVPAGQLAKIHGVIESRDGNKVQVREDANTEVVLITNASTHIVMRSGLFGMSHKAVTTDDLLPGLYVDAEGRGTEHGEVMTKKIEFQPGDLRAARTADTRVRPVESRTGALEARATADEGRTDQLESRAGDLEKRAATDEDKQQQTDQQVAAVKDSATQAGDAAQKANTGVASLGDRVTSLDDYETKTSATVLFAFNSARLTPKAKSDLDGLVQSLDGEKGYMIEVAGFADTTGNAERNQVLSEERASAVVQYLQEQGNVPLRRILAPAGLGTTHAVADNRSPQGRRENRRVEVRVLVNRGLTGGTAPAQTSSVAPAADPRGVTDVAEKQH